MSQKPRGRSVQTTKSGQSSVRTFYLAIIAVALIVISIVAYNTLGGSAQVEGSKVLGVVPAARGSELPVGLGDDGPTLSSGWMSWFNMSTVSDFF